MKKPAVIAFSTSYYPFMGGAEIAIQEVARRLRNQFDFFILTARFDRKLLPRESRSEGIIIRVGWGIYLDKYFFPLLSLFAARKIMRKHDATILWGMDISAGSVGASLVRLFFQKPFILTLQYGYGDARIRHGRGGLIQIMFRLMLHAADQVTAISNYLLEAAATYGYKGKTVLIHNGVEVSRFAAQTASRKEVFPKTVITTSRLVRKNGIDLLIRSIAAVKKQIPQIRCLILGDGAERKSLEQLAEKLQLTKEVKFLGPIPYEKLPEYLHQADVFVRPSRSEGMGNSFVEALAAGIPIIGTSVGGITDIIEDGRTGYFARADDPADLAEKIIFVLRHPDQAAATVASGKKLISGRFEWDTIARSYGAVFENKLKKKKRVLIATGLFPPDIGGPATYSKLLYDELPAYRFDVSLESFGSVRKYPKLFRHTIYFLRLIQGGFSSDIIFAQDPVSVGLPAVMAAKLLRKKFVLKVVGDYAWEQAVQHFGVEDSLDDFLQKKYWWRVELLRVIEHFVARRADIIITPSFYLKRVVAQWGVQDPKIKVIYNSFDIPEENVTRADARKKLGLEGTILISAGRMVPWKGFEMLIRLMPEIVFKTPDAKLIIIGSGPEKKNLELLAARHPLGAAIRFVGQLSHEELLTYLAAGDLFLLNTAYEGFSHLILEAMASGIPIITTTVGGNPELIKNGESGILLAYNDGEGFKNAIRELARSHDRARLYAGAAKNRLERFTKEKMIEATISVLQSV